MDNERKKSIARAMREALPASSQSEIAAITDFIIQLITQTETEHSQTKEVTIDAALVNSLEALGGTHISTSESLISFHQSDQQGDITIRDVAGGNITTIHLSIALNRATSASGDTKREYTSSISDILSSTELPKLSEAEWNDILINKPLQLAASDARRIVPILGLGVSSSITGIQWEQFLSQLTRQSGLIDIANEYPAKELPDVLQNVRHVLGSQNFIAAVQRLLHTSPGITTTAIQAIVTSRIRRIITLNLDHSLEEGYALAHLPLPSKNVGIGCKAEELDLFNQNIDEVVLLKVHGGLERPSSWVLTRDDHNHAYHEPGLLASFLSDNSLVPLLIGFDDEKYGLTQIIDLTRMSNGKRSYAIIPRDMAMAHLRALNAAGITPIGYYTNDQIAEAIDQIFNCKDIEAKRSTTLFVGKSITHLLVGGSTVEIPQCTEQEDLIAKATPILLNAFELRQIKNRKHGTKRHYLERILGLIKDKEYQALEVVLRGIIQYQDITDTLVNSVLYREDLDSFQFFNLLFEIYSSKPELSERLELTLLKNLHNADLSYRCLRNIAKITANRRIHPALRLPPLTAKVDKLMVAVYPITRYQVGTLFNRQDLKDNNPCWPYTIHSIDEADEIVRKLRTATQQPWRLPTPDEWLSIARVKHQTWPWGEDYPAYKTHAHLNFLGTGGRAAAHPIEIGVFPRGQSSEGLFDLIGNVYELVSSRYKDFSLAGGAWTTNFIEGKTKFVYIKLLSKRGKNNVGIRPVMPTQA